jgi:hypothetical protein
MARIILAVDLVTADVEAYIMDDEVQEVPIIVGQSFLNRANVTMVMKDNQVRLFEKHLAILPDVDALPPRKFALCAKDAVNIPPRTISFIEIGSSGDSSGEVYVEGVHSQQPGREYSIPGCITSVGGMISFATWRTQTLRSLRAN